MQVQLRLSPDYSGQLLIQEELVKLKTSKKKLHFAATNKRLFILDLRNPHPIFTYGKSQTSQKKLQFTNATKVENISRGRQVLSKAKFGMKISNIRNEQSGCILDLKLFTSDALILDLFLTAFSHLYFTYSQRFLYEGNDQSTRVPLLTKAKSQDHLVQKQSQSKQMLQIGCDLDGFLSRVLSASTPERARQGQIKEELSLLTSEQEQITTAFEDSPRNTIAKRKKKDKYGSGYLVTSHVSERGKRSHSKESSSSRFKQRGGVFLKQRSKSERALRLNLEDLEGQCYPAQLLPQICVNGTEIKRRYMMVDSITTTKMEKHLPDTEPIFDFQD